LPPDFVAYADLISVNPISPDDQRYLESQLDIHKIEIFQDGQQARLAGLLGFQAVQSDVEQSTATTVWISAIAYDGQKNIVGIRKWIADDILTSGNQIDFDFNVYSLGPPIENVDILTEIRP